MRKYNFIKWLFRRRIKNNNSIVPRVNFGWKRDIPDHRDVKFKISIPRELPSLVDLRPNCPPVYNQGNLGSCTANALGAVFQYEQRMQNKPDWIPSRLFIYYNERVIEGTVSQDSGAMIRDGIKTMVKEGVCPESLWGYVENKFKIKPSSRCYDTALNHQVLEYLRISPHSLYEIKNCLHDGHPIAFGFTIYESMMTSIVSKTGYVPVPNLNDRPIGGHAVTAVGYDDSKECLIVRNSWGDKWGLGGYFYLPYWYVVTPNASADYWTIRLIE